VLSNFHVQIKQKTSYLAMAILLVSVLFASCVLPSLKLGSASIKMNIAIPQYMEKTARTDSSARFIHPDAEKLVVTIEASDMDTATYTFAMTPGINTISINKLAPGENRTITVALYNKNTDGADQVLAKNNKIVDIKAGQNILAFVLAPVHTDDSFEAVSSPNDLKLEIDDLTDLAGKTQVYDFEIKEAGDYKIKAEFNNGNGSSAYSPNIYDETGKKVTGSNGIYNLKSGKYFFVVSIPTGVTEATSATFTVEKTPYGSEHNPILIASAEELKTIGTNSAGKYYKQTANIDLLNEENWTPISTFKGHYDGDNFEIKGLKITTETEVSYAGLFGMLTNAEVKNVRLIGVDITTPNGASIGGLAGSVLSSSIENCHVSGKITVTNPNSTLNVGGLVGNLIGSTTIKKSSSNTEIETTGKIETTSGTGGLVGYVGGSAAPEITESFSLGNITSNINAGGLIGATGLSTSGRLTVEKSFSAVEIKVADNSNAQFGGLIGLANATSNASINIKNSYATGSITKGNAGSAEIGGFIGKISGTIEIQGSWSLGDVGDTGDTVGLFVGTVDGTGTKTASNSYVQMPNTGGGEIIGNGSISGFTANDNVAKDQNSMLNLTASNLGDSESHVWNSGSEGKYPYLNWQDSFTEPWEAPIPRPS
jgi:hypothetical protein